MLIDSDKLWGSDTKKRGLWAWGVVSCCRVNIWTSGVDKSYLVKSVYADPSWCRSLSSMLMVVLLQVWERETPQKQNLYPRHTGNLCSAFKKKEEGRMFVLYLLLPSCLQLKITPVPKWHILERHVLIPFTGHPDQLYNITIFPISAYTTSHIQAPLLSNPGLSTFSLSFSK